MGKKITELSFDGMTFDEIVAYWEPIKQQIDDLNLLLEPLAEIDSAVKAEVKKRMVTSKESTVLANGRKFKLSQYDKDNFDSKTFKVTHPRLFKKFSSTSTITRLTIK
jgi:hypothetical protein